MTLPFTGFVVPSGGSSSGGSGDVTGPGSSTDNAIARFDGTGGKTLQDSGILVTDAAQLSWEGATADDFETTLGVTDPTADRTILLPNESGTLVVGSTGSTDDRILISDGTGGATLAASGFSIDSNGTGKLVTSGSGTKVHVALGSVDVGIGTHATTNSGNLHVLEADLGNWAGINALDFYIANTGMNITESFSGMGLRSDGGIVVLNENSSDMRHIRASILVEANTAGSGTPNVITQYESLTTFTNEGTTAANYHTLPTAAAGYAFEFIVQDADGIRIVANTDDTIRVIDKVTAAAGYIESTTIGSTVRLVSINAVEWFATSIHGVWTDGTFTFDDTGSTSP